MVSCLAARSAAAWALPRPSATASARLAKTTVSHSHTTVAQANHEGSPIASTVVNTAPISTMNMTGLRHMRRRIELPQRVRQGADQLLGVEQAAADLAVLRGRCLARRLEHVR